LRIAIIGGAGKMGRWFTRYFASQGHKIVISGVKLDKLKAFAREANVAFADNNAKAVKDADIAIISVPIPATAKLIREVAPNLRKGTVIAEIASLKFGIIEALVEASRLGVIPLSLHPLFGPGAQKLKENKIVVVPVLNSAAEIKLAKRLFQEAEIVVADADEHDRIMALTISLPYFMNIAFASTLGEEDISKLKKFGGTTFAFQLTLTESVMNEDPALNASIQMHSEYAIKYIEAFLSKAENLRKIISEKNQKDFIDFCKEVQGLLSKDTDFFKAYEKEYKAIEAMR
jgi:prephenate dehydrogenase